MTEPIFGSTKRRSRTLAVLTYGGGWEGICANWIVAGREVFLQLRSRRPDLVCMLQGTQVLFTRSTRNARSSLAVCHGADSKSRTSGAARHARRGDLRCYEAVDPGSKEPA